MTNRLPTLSASYDPWLRAYHAVAMREHTVSSGWFKASSEREAIELLAGQAGLEDYAFTVRDEKP